MGCDLPPGNGPAGRFMPIFPENAGRANKDARAGFGMIADYGFVYRFEALVVKPVGFKSCSVC
jgi:hypothetical protein